MKGIDEVGTSLMDNRDWTKQQYKDSINNALKKKETYINFDICFSSENNIIDLCSWIEKDGYHKVLKKKVIKVVF